jgi:hypothetical protein
VQCSNTEAYITFNAQGTATNDNPVLNLTGGTFQVTNSSRPDAQALYSGKIYSGFYNVDNGKIIILLSYTPDRVPSSGPICVSTDDSFNISTVCNPDIRNEIGADWQNDDSGHFGHFGDFSGGVSCSGLSPSSSSPTTTGTTAQDRDSDGDGIPDSSDKCTHNSNPRCFKEDATNS